MYDVNMTEKIIDFIRENKVSTTEVADCLSKTGALSGVMPINKGKFKVGEIAYVYAHSDTNWPIHDQLRFLEHKKIIFIDATNVIDKALFGELVAYFMLEKLEAISIVTNGLVRDANELISNEFPIWCRGLTPEGCFNINREMTPDIKLKVEKNKVFYDGAIAVCDDCGVVIIPKDHIDHDMYNKLINIEKQEKIWFECVKNKNWNTFDTVCLKKYLEK